MSNLSIHRDLTSIESMYSSVILLEALLQDQSIGHPYFRSWVSEQDDSVFNDGSIHLVLKCTREK